MLLALVWRYSASRPGQAPPPQKHPTTTSTSHHHHRRPGALCLATPFALLDRIWPDDWNHWCGKLGSHSSQHFDIGTRTTAAASSLIRLQKTQQQSSSSTRMERRGAAASAGAGRLLVVGLLSLALTAEAFRIPSACTAPKPAARSACKSLGCCSFAAHRSRLDYCCLH